MILYMYIHVAPGQGGWQPLGDEIFMSTGTTCHFGHLLQVLKKISLKSDFMHFFFHDFIHVYSPGAGAWQPLGDEIFMSTGTSCHFGHLLQVLKKISLKSDFIFFFHDFIHVYSPGAGADSPQRTKF